MVACFGSSIKLEWSHRLRVALCTPSRLATSCVEYNFICPGTSIFVYRCQGIIQGHFWSSTSIGFWAISADKRASALGNLPQCRGLWPVQERFSSFFRQPKAPPHLVPVEGPVAGMAPTLVHVFHLSKEVNEHSSASRVLGRLARCLPVESR
jgi:hypothetical protein